MKYLWQLVWGNNCFPLSSRRKLEGIISAGTGRVVLYYFGGFFVIPTGMGGKGTKTRRKAVAAGKASSAARSKDKSKGKSSMCNLGRGAFWDCGKVYPRGEQVHADEDSLDDGSAYGDDEWEKDSDLDHASASR
jgi:hypothetical protein